MRGPPPAPLPAVATYIHCSPLLENLGLLLVWRIHRSINHESGYPGAVRPEGCHGALRGSQRAGVQDLAQPEPGPATSEDGLQVGTVATVRKKLNTYFEVKIFIFLRYIHVYVNLATPPPAARPNFRPLLLSTNFMYLNRGAYVLK